MNVFAVEIREVDGSKGNYTWTEFWFEGNEEYQVCAPSRYRILREMRIGRCADVQNFFTHLRDFIQIAANEGFYFPKSLNMRAAAMSDEELKEAICLNKSAGRYKLSFH